MFEETRSGRPFFPIERIHSTFAPHDSRCSDRPGWTPTANNVATAPGVPIAFPLDVVEALLREVKITDEGARTRVPRQPAVRPMDSRAHCESP